MSGHQLSLSSALEQPADRLDEGSADREDEDDAAGADGEADGEEDDVAEDDREGDEDGPEGRQRVEPGERWGEGRGDGD